MPPPRNFELSGPKKTHGRPGPPLDQRLVFALIFFDLFHTVLICLIVYHYISTGFESVDSISGLLTAPIPDALEPTISGKPFRLAAHEGFKISDLNRAVGVRFC